jgi:predicted metal-binding membrane protein
MEASLQHANAALRPRAKPAALVATVGLAAVAWGVTVWQMNGMAMGVATTLGPFALFVALWAAMMAAMMLPGATPAVLRRVERGGIRTAPLFLGSYLSASRRCYCTSELPGRCVSGYGEDEAVLQGLNERS